MRLWLFSSYLVLSLVLLQLPFLTARSSTDDVVGSSLLLQAKIDWIRRLGGVFSDRIEIREACEEESESNGRHGIFAKEPIDKDETLFVIPRAAVLDEGDFGGRGSYWVCATARNLVHHMRLGSKSKYAPYVAYLEQTQIRSGQHLVVPSGWSDQGKLLLLKLLAQDDNDDDNDLPPMYPVTDDYEEECARSEDDVDPEQLRMEHDAALLLLQRGWDNLMIPIYDMMNHHNGHGWLNTYLAHSVHELSKPVTVKAKRDIDAGEELYSTYNFCKDCGNRASGGYGTPEIFRDYGFVESYPQRWFFGRRMNFIVDQVVVMKKGETNALSIELRLEWFRGILPTKAAVRELSERLENLKEVGWFDLEIAVDDRIPQHELQGMVQFFNSTVTAMELALTEAPSGYVHDCDGDNQHVCALSRRYDDLSFHPDDLDYFAASTCDDEESLSFKGFTDVERVKSHYQEMIYSMHDDTGDVCFHINKVLQICGSYRPHYHEMVVHYAAQFLPEIKRALWVGGGDSMLLHEIIKYPTLEFVVGLEIDQVVTRMAFKHFGMQPHFDQHTKVQWWFGDAAKSLLMLPASYFGSFDLVLVDLSETVTSKMVTEGLDILQALTLLLKPAGILVKNELYMEEMAAVATYALQINIPHVPFICDQCLVFGSHKVDFLYESLTDHELNEPEPVFVQHLVHSNTNNTFELWHDYRKNATAVHLCRNEEENDQDSEPESKQDKSPGILMVVEVEDVNAGIDLRDSEGVLSIIAKGVERSGLVKISVSSVASKTGSDDGDDDSGPRHDLLISILLEEGYVVIRTFARHNYCAVDLHLWSSFEKQEAAKIAIVEALTDCIGGCSSSSYRVVAGGMFGVKTWRQDEKNKGPRVTETCNKDERGIMQQTFKAETTLADVMLDETIQLIPTDKKFVVAIVCGQKQEECSSLNVITKKHHDMSIIPLPLLSCSDISNDYREGILESMMACERSLLSTLLRALENANQRIRAVVFDPKAAYSFSRVAYKVFKAKKARLFDLEHLYSMSVVLGDSDVWRRNLMERFRKEIILHDPNFRAEVLFNGTDGSSIEMGLTYSGDEQFIPKLKETVLRIEERTGLTSEVRSITGGLYVFEENWTATYYMPEDMDQTASLEQYMSQQPVGYQTVFQLEWKRYLASELLSLSADTIKTALEAALLEVGLISLASETGVGELSRLGEVQFHIGNGMGDGCVVVALFAGGTCVVLWDGRQHMDLSLFTYVESKDIAKQVEKEFISNISTTPKMVMKTALCDFQPRGYGRVVNFKSDLVIHDGNNDAQRPQPRWAKVKEEE